MNSFALRPGWNPLNIALMVVAFIIFWPLGLAMLAYIIWGDRFPALAAEAKEKLGFGRGDARSPVFSGPRGPTGNIAFDEFRAAEIARLEEERRRLDEMRDEFDAYLTELRRAKDREEFERFMADRARDRAAHRQGGVPSTGDTAR